MTFVNFMNGFKCNLVHCVIPCVKKIRLSFQVGPSRRPQFHQQLGFFSCRPTRWSPAASLPHESSVGGSWRGWSYIRHLPKMDVNIIHGENGGGPLGMVPLIINPITIPRVPAFSLWIMHKSMGFIGNEGMHHINHLVHHFSIIFQDFSALEAAH